MGKLVQFRRQSVEGSLVSIGYEMEQAKLRYESLTADIRTRAVQVRKWAKVSGLSPRTVNFLIDEGAAAARREVRK